MSADRGVNTTLHSWGNNTAGQMGDGTQPPESRAVGTSYEHEFRARPGEVRGLPPIAAVTVYSDSYSKDASVYAVTANGDVWAWGLNLGGRLGDGSETFVRARPIRLTGLDSVTEVVGGFTSAFALKSDGTVWAWGTLRVSQQWPPVCDTPDPLAVAGLNGIVALTAATDTYRPVATLYALDSDGTIWRWDPSEDEQPDRLTRVVLPTDSPVRSVVAQAETAYATCADGSVWAWGGNSNGELGDETTTESTPIRIAALSNIACVIPGYQRAYAVTSDGLLWAWGRNQGGGILGLVDGTLGIGPGRARTGPVHVAGLPPVASVAIGGWSTYALSVDGTVWLWGDNRLGQLGLASTDNQSTPALVPDLDGVTAIVTDQNSVYAVKSDGTVSAWGENWQGKLGDGTTTDRSAPVSVSGLNNVIAVNVAGSTGVAIARSDVSLAFNAANGDGGELVTASRDGDAGAVDLLLAGGADPNTTGPDGSPLLAAVKMGHREIVESLVSSGADLEMRSGGTTALMAAAELGDDRLVRFIVRLGADLDAVDGNGHTALYHAASNLREQTVGTLLELGADLNESGGYRADTPLLAAGRQLNSPIVLALLRNGAKADDLYRGQIVLSFQHEGTAMPVPLWALPDLLDRPDLSVGDMSSAPEIYSDRMRLDNGRTPLMFWASAGVEHQVRALLEGGAPPDATDADGDNASSYAISRKSLSVLETLLEYGSSPDAWSSLIGRGESATVLHVAATAGWRDGLRALLEHGADVDARSSSGITPIMLAAGAGHDDCVTELNDHGAHLDAMDDDGDPALFYAASNRRESTVGLLLSMGADPRQIRR